MEDITDFLSKLADSETYFKKMQSPKGESQLYAFSRDKNRTYAVAGYYNFPDLQDLEFVIKPSELRKLFRIGSKLTTNDGHLIIYSDEYNTTAEWRINLPDANQPKKVDIDYSKSRPIRLPDTFCQKLGDMASAMQVKNYDFEIKDKVLKVTITGVSGDSLNTMNISLKEIDLPDVSVRFPPGSLEQLFKKWEVELNLMDTGEPSRFKVTGEGYMVYYYIVPISR